jgi:dihydropyrimidinase/allantoinase
VFVDGKLIKSNLVIQNGKIKAISNNTLPAADETIDAAGKIILPGGIDVHTHILDLVFSYREDFSTGTQSAASGGITTVLEMPLGLEGKTALESFELQRKEMQEKCVVDYGLIGSAGHNTLEFIPELAKRGVVGFKTFMIHASEEEYELKDLDAKNDFYLLQIFSEIAKTGLVSSVHAENDAIISHNIAKFIAEGKTDFQAHTDSRPSISEDEACLRAMVLANQAKVKLNLVHMSSKQSFDYIRKAKASSWDVSCEITPHHLFFTSEDFNKIGTWLKVNPPIRTKDHQTAAWEALNAGSIDMVASDHSPYSFEEKDLSLKNNNIFEVGSGTVGLETTLPLLLDAVNQKRLSLKRLVECISETPAKRFGLYPRKGSISVGADADLVIIDMQKEYTVKKEDMFTKLKVTVFDDWTIRGKIEKTLVRGKVIYDNGKILEKKGYGEFITPSRK